MSSAVGCQAKSTVIATVLLPSAPVILVVDIDSSPAITYCKRSSMPLKSRSGPYEYHQPHFSTAKWSPRSMSRLGIKHNSSPHCIGGRPSMIIGSLDCGSTVVAVTNKSALRSTKTKSAARRLDMLLPPFGRV